MYTGYQEELSKTKVISQNMNNYILGTGGEFNYADSQILFHKAFDTVQVLCDKDANYTQTMRKYQRLS